MSLKKKTLQNIADKSMKSAHNTEFKQNAESMIECKTPQKVRANNKLVWALSSVAALLVVVSVIMLFTFPVDKPQETPSYGADFETVMKSSIEELNNDLKGFSFYDHGEYGYVTRMYDEKTNDTLMYIYAYDNFDDAENNAYTVYMHVVTNPYYNDIVYANKVFDKSTDYNGYLLEYREKTEYSEGMYEFNIEGKLQINGVILCFEYQSISFTEDNGLVDMLDNLIYFN